MSNGIYDYVEDVKQLNEQDQKIADLEVKLEEIRKQITICDEENSKTFMKFVDVCRQNAELKQQLAEKDKEIAYMTKQAKKFNNEAQKYFEDAYCNDSIYQDKISFCIEQLSQAKDKIKKLPCAMTLTTSAFEQIYKVDATRQIDNQIKQLKEQQN